VKDVNEEMAAQKPQEEKEGGRETEFGTVEISDSVILELASVALGKVEEVVKDPKNKKPITLNRKNAENTVSLAVNVKLYLTSSIREVAGKIQKNLKEEIEELTGMISVENVSVNVLDIEILPPEEKFEDSSLDDMDEARKDAQNHETD